MSAPEQQTESRSSVKFSLNSKGEGQIEVKRYPDVDDAVFQALRKNAQDEFAAGIEWLESVGLRAA